MKTPIDSSMTPVADSLGKSCGLGLEYCQAVVSYDARFLSATSTETQALRQTLEDSRRQGSLAFLWSQYEKSLGT